MALNVLLTRRFFQSDVEYIKNGVVAGVNIIVPRSFSGADLIDAAKDADIFFGPIISKELCQASKRLKFIQVPWTGVDNLNFELIREIGITVCNSHSNAYAVAEHAIALMLDAAKKISYHDHLMRAGNWNRPRPDKSNSVSPFSYRISNSDVGIIGFGHIGKLIKDFLQGFKCRFHITDINISKREEIDDISFYPSKEQLQLLSNSQFVFICVPLTEESRGFFSTAQFDSMKSSAILINTSRGEVVDEYALFNALSTRQIAGAAMDTWYNNPQNPLDVNCKPSLNNSFEILDNLVLSPHRAAMIEGELPHLDDAIRNINRAAHGLEPINIVNPEKNF